MPSAAKTQANRRNPLKHGIFAREALIATGECKENAAEFDRLTDALYQQYEPEGATEQLLVEHLIAFQWRWHRVLRFENAAIASELHDATSAAHFEESVRDPTAFYGVSLHAEPRDLANELAAADSRISELDAPDPLAHNTGLYGHALAIAEHLGAPIDGLLGAEPPWRERSSFDPALVEQTIAAACAGGSLSRSAFWALVRPSVEAARDRILVDIERRDARLRSAQSLAIIPSAAQLDKIHRYEAHLSRQFHRALHELQRIQAARGDLPSPLEGEGQGMRGESKSTRLPDSEASFPTQRRGREKDHEGPGGSEQSRPSPLEGEGQGMRGESKSTRPPDSEASFPTQRRGRERGHEGPGGSEQSLPSPLDGEGPGMRGESHGEPDRSGEADQSPQPTPALNRSARRAGLRQRQRQLRRPAPQSPPPPSAGRPARPPRPVGAGFKPARPTASDRC